MDYAVLKRLDLQLLDNVYVVTKKLSFCPDCKAIVDWRCLPFTGSILFDNCSEVLCDGTYT